MNRISRFLAVLLATTTVGVLPAAAAAQSPDGYTPAGPAMVQDTQPPPGSNTQPSGSDTQPSSPGDNAAPAGSLPSRSVAPAPTAAFRSLTGPGAAQQSGALPFTGLDLGLTALAGLAVIALGVGLRRVSTRPSAAR